MDLTRMRRGIVLSAMTALVVTACSSGGSASPSAATSAAPSAAATAAPTATPAPTAAAVTLEYLVDDSQANQQLAKAFADAYTAKHPNVTINVQSRPGGSEGDNVVKTKLATGDMTDIFWYNSGSLLQALNPTQTLVDLTGEPYIANIADSFIPTVSQNGGFFGVPSGTAMGGGILYNKKVFAANGLSVPTTWAEFEANNDKLKAAGITPVGATYKAPDDWTSQLFILSDYCNVSAAVPNFAADYTNNKIKYADTPAALAGFQHLQEGFRQGLVREELRGSQLRRRSHVARDRQVRPVPDADVRPWNHRDPASRVHQGHRVLRAPRHGRRKELRDDLDAGSHLHPEDDDGRQARRREGFPGVHRLR